ncbi:MAG TPA: hypothetical protein VGJ04_09980 [Pirellulales bacterium]
MKPRFTIRDLFWLMAVLALSLGWWLHYRKMQASITRLQNAAPMVSIQDDRIEKGMHYDAVEY